MDKNMIYKMVFKQIQDSIEWSTSCKDTAYAWYVDGVVSLAESIINELGESTDCKPVE